MTAETKRIKPASYYKNILCFDISSIINRTGVLHRHFSSHTRPANMSCEATFKKIINKETKNAAWRQFKAIFLHSSHLKNVCFTFYLSCCTSNYWVISVFGITPRWRNRPEVYWDMITGGNPDSSSHGTLVVNPWSSSYKLLDKV